MTSDPTLVQLTDWSGLLGEDAWEGSGCEMDGFPRQGCFLERDTSSSGRTSSSGSRAGMEKIPGRRKEKVRKIRRERFMVRESL